MESFRTEVHNLLLPMKPLCNFVKMSLSPIYIFHSISISLGKFLIISIFVVKTKGTQVSKPESFKFLSIVNLSASDSD